MFHVIKIYKRKIKCNVDYDNLKQQLDKLSNQDDKFIKNAKMECNRIINGGFLEFNYSVSTLLLALASFLISLFGTEKAPWSIPAFVVYVVSIIGIGLLSINLHMRKQNAEKIKYILENK